MAKDIAAYKKTHGNDDMTGIVESIFSEYRATLDEHHISFSELDEFLSVASSDFLTKAGSIDLHNSDLFPVSTEDASRFIMSRRSVRQFTGKQIPKEEIEAAVILAQNAPSVCNRQSGRVFCSNTPEVMARMLAHQNGNRGFGHLLGAVVIVTSDIEKFHTVGERNQPFVDGGIFAMSLALGLHARGIAACMLNWSVEPKTDAALRKEFSIPDNQVVITMIGCGYPVDPARVAASPRDPVTDILHWL